MKWLVLTALCVAAVYIALCSVLFMQDRLLYFATPEAHLKGGERDSHSFRRRALVAAIAAESRQVRVLRVTDHNDISLQPGYREAIREPIG